ncbi:LysR family transcriptional regulator [Oceanospirillum sediminis]|uniref:LysR family transcriptional regulator n=1 Tax=Oceanospirillum sediminis TaxID=2760088 RepID=A0A839IWB9_9GAMM|nr:LysR family transcriptional regulator [Oceanospirillum sediminis]MBB1488386.1 LysR family transcriptional regulator [Oceanospirillum sediminis]
MIPSQLPVFISVVKNGNFSSAARQLGVSSAAVSKSISQLEKVLSLRLFHRTTHSLTLTEDGQDLLRRTEPLLKELEDQIRLSTDKQLSPHGKLKVNLPDSFGRQVVMPLLPGFLDKYPDIEFELNFDDAVGDLVKEGADVGIGAKLNPDSRLIARRFYNLQPVIIASKRYLEQHGVPQTPEDLEHHNCIAYRSSTTGRIYPWPFMENGEEHQIEPKGNLTVNSLSAGMKAVEMDLGIAMVGVWYLKDNPAAANLRRLLPDYAPEPFPVWIYYSSRSYLPAKTRLFIDYLLDNAIDEQELMRTCNCVYEDFELPACKQA